MTESATAERAARRLDEAREDIAAVRREVDGWLEKHAEQKTHHTRLRTLHGILDPALADVAGDLDADPAGLPAAYAAARRADIRSTFCRRLWQWYVLRFGQRTGPTGDCLAGADEIVWSVWHPVVRASGMETSPAPLAFVDNDPVPSASMHHALPAEARPPSVDKFMKQRITELPIPVIALPPVVLHRPWWLVVAVHETAHHLAESVTTTVALQDTVATAVRSAGAPPGEQALWRNWTGELFADVVAAVFAGGASLWPISELEVADRAGVLAPRPSYPPAVVRLHAARRAVEAVGGVPLNVTVCEADVDLAPLAHLLAQAEAGVSALLEHPLGATTLRDLAPAQPDRTHEVNKWRDRLAAPQDPQPVRSLDAPLESIAGAVLAWRAGVDGALLRDRVLSVVKDCGEPGVRADAPEVVSTAAAAHRFTVALREMPDGDGPT